MSKPVRKKSLCIFFYSLDDLTLPIPFIPTKKVIPWICKPAKQKVVEKCQLINQVHMALPGKETFTYNQNDVCVSVLQKGFSFFPKKKARIQNKYSKNQVFKVLLSMIKNFFDLFKSWSLTLKILTCVLLLMPACSLPAVSLWPASCTEQGCSPWNSTEGSAGTQVLLSPPPFHCYISLQPLI